MKNIKSYRLFEMEKSVMEDWIKTLNKDPLIKKWFYKIEFIRPQDFFGDDVCEIKTPYEEIKKLNFSSDGGQYTGDSIWEFVSSAMDEYNIKYLIPGHGRGQYYPEPDETYWNIDAVDVIFTEDFKFLKFFEDMMIKNTLICSKIYELAPQEIKDVIRKDLIERGIGINLLKGGSLINRFIRDI